MLRLATIVAALVAALALVGAASASTTRPYYMDELKLGNYIESHGFRPHPYSRKVLVDSAFCSGLRRYGVRSGGWGLDRYWHFDCSVDDSRGHFWDVKVKTVLRGGYWWLYVTSAKYEF